MTPCEFFTCIRFLIRLQEKSLVVFHLQGFADTSSKKELGFVYDAMGNRISKKVYSATGTLQKTTYYIRDAQGNVMSVYEYEIIEAEATLLQSEVHIYGSSRLGTYNPINNEMIGATNPTDTSHFEFERGHRQYELSNHLGNVLSITGDQKLGVDSSGFVQLYNAEVESYSDYSPFGTVLYGRSWSAESYRYGFDGEEKDTEGMGGGNQTYDYGFRIYNPALARFLSADPLSRAFVMLSPYQYASNTPIAAIDLDGLEARVITYEWCQEDKVVDTHIELTIDIVLINNSTSSLQEIMNMYNQLKPMVSQTFSGEEFDNAILNITYIEAANADDLYNQALIEGKKVIYVEIRDDFTESDKAKLIAQGNDPNDIQGFTARIGQPKANLIKLINRGSRSVVQKLRTALHELGHMLGLSHPDNVDDDVPDAVVLGDPNFEGKETCSPNTGENMDNLMIQSGKRDIDGRSATGTVITAKQRGWIRKLLGKKGQEETYSGGN